MAEKAPESELDITTRRAREGLEDLMTLMLKSVEAQLPDGTYIDEAMKDSIRVESGLVVTHIITAANEEMLHDLRSRLDPSLKPNLNPWNPYSWEASFRLLDALQDLVRSLEMTQDMDPNPLHPRRFQFEIQQAHKALARARGEEPPPVG